MDTDKRTTIEESATRDRFDWLHDEASIVTEVRERLPAERKYLAMTLGILGDVYTYAAQDVEERDGWIAKEAATTVKLVERAGMLCRTLIGMLAEFPLSDGPLGDWLPESLGLPPDKPSDAISTWAKQARSPRYEVESLSALLDRVVPANLQLQEAMRELREHLDDLETDGEYWERTSHGTNLFVLAIAVCDGALERTTALDLMVVALRLAARLRASEREAAVGIA